MAGDLRARDSCFLDLQASEKRHAGENGLRMKARSMDAILSAAMQNRGTESKEDYTGYWKKIRIDWDG